MLNMNLAFGSDGIALLTLDQADLSTNIMSDAWMTDFETVLDEITAREDCSGLVIASAKSSFLAGADLAMLYQRTAGITLRDGFELSQRVSHLLRRLELLGKPVAAAIEGPALGGGLELALACTRRIIADNPKAVLSLPEVNLGLLPAAGGTQRLPRMIGASKALDLLLSGRAVRPNEALELGIADAVVPAGTTIEAARTWLLHDESATRAWDMKGFSSPEARGLVLPEVAAAYSLGAAAIAGRNGHNYPAPIAILSCVFEGMRLPMDLALQIESKYFARLLADPKARNIIRTTFLSRQAAMKGARRPQGFAKIRVSRLGIIGAGLMGGGIALAAAKAGIATVLIDRTVALAEKGKDYSATALGKLVASGKMSGEDRDRILALIEPSEEFAELAGCDLVIEAVFEDIGIKVETIRKAESHIRPDAIYASNTSTLPISGLAASAQRPGQVIGLHFFSPAERMDLVEVIMGKQTTPQTLASALDFLAHLGKLPIVVTDGRGFYTSRVVQRFITEGAAMVQEGISPARIENAARAAGFPVGPLALLDEVAIDLPIKIFDQAREQEGDAFAPPSGIDVLRKMQNLGRLGRKVQAGFYEYGGESGKKLWPGLASIYPEAANQPGQEELQQRLFFIQALETVRCLDEGILQSPQDADLGAIFGWGFPTWAGGPLSYIDMVGTGAFVMRADQLAEQYGARFEPPPYLRARAEREANFY